MGKPSKNSGGDERMNDRRYKSSSNPSKASSSEKQGEAESSNRSKQSAVALKQNSGVIKNKSKLRSPPKSGLGNPTNRLNRPNIVSEDKGSKKSGAVVKDKSQISKMKQQNENSEKKDKRIESTEPSEQVIENIKPVIDEVIENSANQHENGVNGKQNSSSNGNGAEIVEINEKEEEFNLHLEVEENGKHDENGVKNSSEVAEKENGEKIEESVDEPKPAEENPSSDTNSCSVDVVESTTSETSEAIASTKSSEVEDKDIESQDANEDGNSESKKMKDVQIKLHDCLKDQTNEESNDADQSAPEYRHKEETFGKTLRTLSGRRSLGRNITLRERQPSPNSSLFVNTSSISVSEDGASDRKSLRQRVALSELTSSINGTPSDKKRRLIEEATSSPKKPKTEESSSLLNSSFEFLKYPFTRRPVQVSTPHSFGEVEKPNISSSEEVKADNESGAGRRWCVLM